MNTPYEMTAFEKADRDIGNGVYDTDAEIVVGLVYEGHTETEALEAVKAARESHGSFKPVAPVYDKSGTNDLPF